MISEVRNRRKYPFTKGDQNWSRKNRGASRTDNWRITLDVISSLRRDLRLLELQQARNNKVAYRGVEKRRCMCVCIYIQFVISNFISIDIKQYSSGWRVKKTNMYVYIYTVWDITNKFVRNCWWNQRKRARRLFELYI